jgi:hypothetical protein
MAGNKLDAALSMELGRADKGNSADAGPLEVTVRLAAPLSTGEAKEATALGVQVDTQHTIFTCRLNPTALKELAKKPFVSQISLSREMRPLGPPRSMEPRSFGG